MTMSRCGLSVLLLQLLTLFAPVWCSQFVYGEVKLLQLPADYADFALNPETGTLAAISAESNEVVFFRSADLNTASPMPVVKQTVGMTPCSIFYKVFQEKHVFAVVCTQDPHMFLFEAGSATNDPSKDFTPLGKILVDSVGNSAVTGSINPEDPFLYYCFGSGHSSKTGVVSLRDFEAHGIAFEGSMDCAVSASGEIAYRRGPWTPSGFESLIRTNPLSETTPLFSRLFFNHVSAERYIPDPFERLTAVGPGLYSRSLETLEHTLSFTPLAFFQSRPIIVGIPSTGPGADLGVKRNPAPTPTSITIHAASYNNFAVMENSVKLEFVAAGGDRSLVRGVDSQSDFKKVVKRVRLFADDANLRCLYADGNQLCLFPLSDFGGADEPFLTAKLDKTEQLLVGRENRMTLKPLDARIELSINEKPDGITVDGENLVWTPNPNQIGPAVIVTTLKHGTLQKTQRFELNVTYPGLPLPFTPAGFVINDSADLAFLWEAAVPIPFRPRNDAAIVGAGRIAVVELKGGEIQQQRRISNAITYAAIDSKHVFIVPAQTGAGASRCEILKITDLEREKSLVTDSPVTHLELRNNLLILQTATSMDIYDATTFVLLKVFRATAPGSPGNVTNVGFYVNDILYGFDLKPKLLVSPGRIPQLGGERRLQPPASVNPPEKDLAGTPRLPGQDLVRLTSALTPDGDVRFDLEYQAMPIAVEGAVHTRRTAVDIWVAASGAVEAKQVLLRETNYPEKQRQLKASAESPPPAGLLQVNTDKICAVVDRMLFLWPIPPRKNAGPAPLEILPQQSLLVMTDDGATELTHELRGGRPPFSFSLLATTAAISIDEAKGTVRIDKSRAMTDAMDLLELQVRNRNRGESFVQTSQNLFGRTDETLTTTFEVTADHIPVAMPILVTVNDADLYTTTLQYSVILKVPAKEFKERLQTRDVAREKQIAEMRAERAQGEATKQANGMAQSAASAEKELKDVKRRLASVEDRLDMVTRQLNEVLKKLDKEPM